ncbi:MAG TPA: cytochrome c3 family protein [Pyrinomonadaceae bacterium]|nr:cytochrome c3 family protein [Pyrinomonadaceae bacterium]
MAKGRQKRIGKIRAITVVLFLAFAVCGLFYPRSTARTFRPEAAEPSQTPARKRTQTRQQPQRTRFTEFSHSIRAHRQSCNSCHKFPTANWKRVRKGKEAFPDVTDYPQHASCINCHRQQFFGSGPRPAICTICHTNPGPRNSARHPFPNPREIFDLTAKGQRSFTEFDIYFPHEKHLELFGKNENYFEESPTERASGVMFVKARLTQDNEQSCAVCHQTYKPQGDADDEYFTKPPAKLGDAFWLKKGTFKTSPISHAQCFTCHNQEAGMLPAPNNCAACHRLEQIKPKPDFDQRFVQTMAIRDKITLATWRERDASGTFRHEFSSHAELSCSHCHNVSTMNTLDFRTKKVGINSCSGCHITETADDGGILNFEVDSRKANASFQCTKCHVVYGRLPIPDSHIKAISAMK